MMKSAGDNNASKRFTVRNEDGQQVCSWFFVFVCVCMHDLQRNEIGLVAGSVKSCVFVFKVLMALKRLKWSQIVCPSVCLLPPIAQKTVK